MSLTCPANPRPARHHAPAAADRRDTRTPADLREPLAPGSLFPSWPPAAPEPVRPSASHEGRRRRSSRRPPPARWPWRRLWPCSDGTSKERSPPTSLASATRRLLRPRLLTGRRWRVRVGLHTVRTHHDRQAHSHTLEAERLGETVRSPRTSGGCPPVTADRSSSVGERGPYRLLLIVAEIQAPSAGWNRPPDRSRGERRTAGTHDGAAHRRRRAQSVAEAALRLGRKQPGIAAFPLRASWGP